MNKSSPEWDPKDLGSLLILDELAPLHYRNRYHDANLTGRAYGGQVLGQALMAAGYSVAEARHASALKLVFLQGTLVNQAIDYLVTPLQDGKRLSSRHVRGMQGDIISLDAHLTFQVDLDGPSHTTPPPTGIPGPEDLPGLSELNPAQCERMGPQETYAREERPGIDFRLMVPDQASPRANPPGLLYSWMRAKRPLPAVPHIQEAAFAYLSDYWTNFCSVAPHVGPGTAQPHLYIVSLNHSLWIHRPHEAHEWLLVVSESPVARDGRSLSQVRFYNRAGDLVASAAQECLMTPIKQTATAKV